jgi:hypothetical protein
LLEVQGQIFALRMAMVYNPIASLAPTTAQPHKIKRTSGNEGFVLDAWCIYVIHTNGK